MADRIALPIFGRDRGAPAGGIPPKAVVTRVNMMRSRQVAALSKYSKIDVHTGVQSASPHKLIEMLLDGALARISVARGCMEHGDTAAKGEQIGWAVSIIGGLQDSLNLKDGGNIAANLEELYSYMQRRLLHANIKNDPAILQEVHDLLSEIRSGWSGIGEQIERRALPATEASTTSHMAP